MNTIITKTNDKGQLHGFNAYRELSPEGIIIAEIDFVDGKMGWWKGNSYVRRHDNYIVFCSFDIDNVIKSYKEIDDYGNIIYEGVEGVFVDDKNMMVIRK